MARKKGFDENKALESAMLLFWKKGYSGTSLKDLEQAMGLKPTSIYNAFGNKRELFQKALNYYLQNVLVKFIEPLATAKTAKNVLTDILKEVIPLHFNKPHPGGCMVVLSLMENSLHDADTNKTLDTALQQLRNAIAKRLKQGQKKGEIRPEIDCKGIANHVTALISGILIMAKAGFPRRELEKLIDSSANVLLP